MSQELGNHTKQNTVTVSGRRPEMEELRCLAMMMVVVLHFLGKGNLLGVLQGEHMTLLQSISWLLEAFAICAVNLYMLLSGYFLSGSHFKLSRLLCLLFQIWTYSLGVAGVAVLLGLVSPEQIDTYYCLNLLFPILEEHYWFVTAYVFLYLLLPLIGNAVRTLDKRAFQAVLGILVTAFCLTKTILPIQFNMDRRGYDCLWYLCMFLLAAYIRRFGLPILERSRRGALLYLFSVGLIYGVTMVLRGIYLKTGSLERVLGMCYDYNHILPTLAALGLFMVFLNRRPGQSRIGRLAVLAGPHTLGVYLLHENLAIRTLWPGWFGCGRVSSVPGLLGALAVAVVTVFAAGVLIEWVRSRLMTVLHRGLMQVKPYRWLIGQIEEVDESFAAK